MDIMRSCRCCLRCPPDKALTAPYEHLGKTEVYVDMLKYCFDIQLPLNGPGSRGICSACVGRLRDASDFKLQVQRSQAELQGAWRVKVESEVKSEADDVDDPVMLNVFDEVAIDNPEVSKGVEGAMDIDPLLKSEVVNMMSDDFLLAPDSPELVVNRPTKVYVKTKEQITSDVQSQEPNLFIPIIKKEMQEDTSEWPKLEAEVNTSKILNREMSKDEEPIVKIEMASEDETEELLGPTSMSACVRERAKIYPVKLERLRGDGGHTSILRRQESYAGEDCGKRLKNKCILEKQKIKQHAPLSSGVKQFVCVVCSSAFPTKLLLLEHKKREHGVTNFKCAECEFTAKSKKSLETHLKSHTVKKVYSCNHCSYITCSRATFKGHLMVHSGLKPYICCHCDYKCRRKFELERHQLIHTGEKPYTCIYCDYKCRDIRNLRRHQMKHTNERPFKCNHCDYRCSRKASLQKHQNTHTGEKPYACSHCDFKCSEKTNLRRHELTHSGAKLFRCNQCGGKYSRKEYLQKHQKTHTGENPYACTHCEFKCSGKAKLRRHELIHSETKLFKCNHCDYQCRQKPRLRDHLRRVHMNEKQTRVTAATTVKLA